MYGDDIHIEKIADDHDKCTKRVVHVQRGWSVYRMDGPCTDEWCIYREDGP